MLHDFVVELGQRGRRHFENQQLDFGMLQAGVLQQFQWKEGGSADTAALMIYFVLCQLASPRPLRASEKQEPKEERTALPHGLRSLPIYEDFIDLVGDKSAPWLSDVQSVADAPSGPDIAAQVPVTPNASILQVPGGWGTTSSANAPEAKTEVTESEIPDSLVARAPTMISPCWQACPAIA